jgi:hypothetical protein
VNGGYAQPGEVHGEIELPGQRLELAGPGARSHVWGDVAAHVPSGGPAAGLAAPVLVPELGRALRYVLTADGWVGSVDQVGHEPA